MFRVYITAEESISFEYFGELDPNNTTAFYLDPQMKRQNTDNERPQGGNKRYRTDPYNEALADGKFELRLLIATKAAGAVIGKGGEYIKSVREKFSALVVVPDKVLTMLCKQEDVKDCFKEILHKLAEEQKRGDLDIRILVHQSHAGAIIGRGGTKIKELREQTSSNIKVFQECCPQSTDRVVSLTSTQDKLPDAIGVMMEFMKDIPIKGIQKQYDATNYDPRMAFVYGGFAPDGPGGRGPGGPPRGPPRGHGGPPMGGPGGGPYDQYNRGGPPGGGYGGGYGGGRGGGPMHGPPMGGGMGGPPGGGYMDGPGVTSTQVTIPNELGGTIIGKGGDRINRIRQESGARIDVGTAYGNEERIITITGNPHQIQSAQFLLQQSVRTSEAGRRYLQEQR
uniref:K Homology domain-containing protein n=1 Tax=Ditylenchus dipsaci TaxID=166011 RepID=A0A915ESE0_9BILA